MRSKPMWHAILLAGFLATTACSKVSRLHDATTAPTLDPITSQTGGGTSNSSAAYSVSGLTTTSGGGISSSTSYQTTDGAIEITLYGTVGEIGGLKQVSQDGTIASYSGIQNVFQTQ